MAIVTYVGSSRAANDPWAWQEGDFARLVEVTRNLPHSQSTASTSSGFLWVQAMAAVGNEPQSIGSITGVESIASPALGSTETESRRRAELAIRLLDKWMADESGYDEETWPKLKAALDRDRLYSTSGHSPKPI